MAAQPANNFQICTNCADCQIGLGRKAARGYKTENKVDGAGWVIGIYGDSANFGCR